MGSTNRVNREYDSLTRRLAFSGYLLTPKYLQKIDRAMECNPLFIDDTGELMPTSAVWIASLSDGERRRFTTLDDLLAFPNITEQHIIALEIMRRGDATAKLDADFDSDGTVSGYAFGPEDQVGSAVSYLCTSVRVVDQDYPWYATHIILSKTARWITSNIMLLAISGLLMFICLYIYGRAKGINVDPRLALSGADYYQRVQQAVQSPDISEKLNVLLMGNFRNFTPVSVYLRDVQNGILISLLALAAGKAMDWLLSHLQSYFPRSYFAIGQQEDAYARLQRARDIWLVGIVLALLVNIVAGIVISFIGR